jgi:hypothetical protein
MHDEAFVRVVRGQGTRKTKEHVMNQEQFGQFWEQLRTPLKAKWEKVTTDDLDDIQGDLAKFGSMLQRRYGELHKGEVTIWANRRHSIGREIMPVTKMLKHSWRCTRR